MWGDSFFLLFLLPSDARSVFYGYGHGTRVVNKVCLGMDVCLCMYVICLMCLFMHVVPARIEAGFKYHTIE